MSTESPPNQTVETHGAPLETHLHIAHEDHDHDPSNPHYFGLPAGVLIATVVAIISVGLVLMKFVHASAFHF